MNTIKSLSIILPTLNEYTNLKILIPQIIIEMNKFSELQYEILVVDDNSDDDTENLIHDFSVTNSNIKFIKRTNPPSLPMSIWEGINNSKSDYVVWLDADGSMPPTTISNLIKKQSQNKESVVIASNLLQEEATRVSKRLARLLFSLLCTMCTNRKIRYLLQSYQKFLIIFFIEFCLEM